MADNHIRARLLRESKLNLQKALDMCRSTELADGHLQQMEGESAHFVRAKKWNRNKQKRTNKSPEQTGNCKYCGRIQDKGKCPAYGKKCTKCASRQARTRQKPNSGSHPQLTSSTR